MTSTAQEIETAASDAIEAGLAGLGATGPAGGAAAAITAAIRDIVGAHLAPVAESAQQAAGAVGDLAKTVEAQQGAADRAITLVDLVNEAISAKFPAFETKLAQLEVKAAQFSASHPILAEIANVLGRVFPHETVSLSAKVADMQAVPPAPATATAPALALVPAS